MGEIALIGVIPLKSQSLSERVLSTKEASKLFPFRKWQKTLEVYPFTLSLPHNFYNILFHL